MYKTVTKNLVDVDQIYSKYLLNFRFLFLHHRDEFHFESLQSQRSSLTKTPSRESLSGLLGITSRVFSPLCRQRRSPCNSRHRQAHPNQPGRSVYLFKLIAALKSRSLISAPQCAHFHRLSDSFNTSFFSPQ